MALAEQIQLFQHDGIVRCADILDNAVAVQAPFRRIHIGDGITAVDYMMDILINGVVGGAYSRFKGIDKNIIGGGIEFFGCFVQLSAEKICHGAGAAVSRYPVLCRGDIVFGKIRADAAFHEGFCVRKRLNITLGSRNHVCRHLVLILIASEHKGNNLFFVNELVRQYHSHCIKRGMIQIIGCDIPKTDIVQDRSEGFRGSV